MRCRSLSLADVKPADVKMSGHNRTARLRGKGLLAKPRLPHSETTSISKTVNAFSEKPRTKRTRKLTSPYDFICAWFVSTLFAWIGRYTMRTEIKTHVHPHRLTCSTFNNAWHARLERSPEAISMRRPAWPPPSPSSPGSPRSPSTSRATQSTTSVQGGAGPCQVGRSSPGVMLHGSCEASECIMVRARRSPNGLRVHANLYTSKDFVGSRVLHTERMLCIHS